MKILCPCGCCYTCMCWLMLQTSLPGCLRVAFSNTYWFTVIEGVLLCIYAKRYLCTPKKLLRGAKNEIARNVWRFQRSPLRLLSSMVKMLRSLPSTIDEALDTLYEPNAVFRQFLGSASMTFSFLLFVFFFLSSFSFPCFLFLSCCFLLFCLFLFLPFSFCFAFFSFRFFP